MRERPIFFAAPMVRALLDGSKTQTRRLVPTWQQPNHEPSPDFPDMAWRAVAQRNRRWGFAVFGSNAEECAVALADSGCCPYGRPGDRLWVRETVADVGARLTYRADIGDGAHCMVKRWTPSIHMPRWASRILLEIVSIHVERLQDISEPDCLAEGVRAIQHEGDGTYYHYEHTHADPGNWCDVDTAYQHLWENINGVGSWDANPWVWVVEFKRVGTKEGDEL